MLLFFIACDPGDEDYEEEPLLETSQSIEPSIDCRERQDVGYSRGSAFTITVVTVDGKPVEVDTANAFEVMRQAAAREGVALRVSSGFRTMSQQQYLYGCYVNCNCNSCNLAARPGYSNHQSGHALDLYTGGNAVSWLRRRGGAFGFRETVSGEPWHWEWWGGGPGGGPCRGQAAAPAAPPPPPPNSYHVFAGKFQGGRFTDVLTISPNGGGGWRDWAALELSNGGGFGSTVWGAATPVHMRNGGQYSDYRVLVGDYDGDGRTDLATVTRNGGGGWRDWLAMELSTGGGFASTVWAAATPVHMRNGDPNADYRALTGDFNGDGRTDILTISPNGGGGWRDWAALEISQGNGFASTVWSAATPIHMRNGDSRADYRVLTGDFDGNGTTDLATITRNGGGGWRDWVAMELSIGSRFHSTVWTANTPIHMRNGDSNADYRVLAGDFNGDGKTDLATITRNGGGGWRDWVAIELSTGSGFHSTVWGANTPIHMRNGDSNADYRVLAGDFNGDGKTDLATITRNGGGGWHDWVAMELSTGSGFTSTVWPASTPVHMRNGGSGADYRVLAADFNGDGKTDLATISRDGGGGWRDWIAIELSTGSGFTSTAWPASTPMHIRNGG
jgi:hypothetical protein